MTILLPQNLKAAHFCVTTHAQHITIVAVLCARCSVLYLPCLFLH